MSPLPRLIALTPGDLAPAGVAPLLEAVSRAASGGLRAVLVREPALGDRVLAALAHEVRARLPASGAWLGVHDRLHVALQVGADALHLGHRSLAPGEARRALAAALRGGGADHRRPAGGEEAVPAGSAEPRRGPLALGLSTHAPDDPASWRGADYLFHGPLRATPSKAGLLEPVGVDGLRRAVERAGLPDAPRALAVLAIGGVEPGDVGPVRAAGAHGVAVLRGVLGAADPAAAAGAYLAALAAASR